MTLAAKYREGNLLIVDNLDMNSGKTKDLMIILKRHDLVDKRVMFVDEEIQENFSLASRNIADFDARKRSHMSVYEMLRKDKLVLSQDCFISLQKQLLAQYQYSGKRSSIKKYMSDLSEAQARIAKLQQHQQ